MSTREEVLERVCAPLYGFVAGHELDRLRRAMLVPMTIPRETLTPDSVVISVSGPEYEICYNPVIADVQEALNIPEIGQVLNTMRDGELGSLAAESIRVYAAEKDHNVTETTMVQSCAELDIASAAILRMHLNSGQSLSRPDHLPVLIVAEYETLRRERKFVFSLLWRRCVTT